MEIRNKVKVKERNTDETLYKAKAHKKNKGSRRKNHVIDDMASDSEKGDDSEEEDDEPDSAQEDSEGSTHPTLADQQDREDTSPVAPAREPRGRDEDQEGKKANRASGAAFMCGDRVASRAP